MLTLVAACLLATRAPEPCDGGHCHGDLPPRVEAIVDHAWAEWQTQQAEKPVQQTPFQITPQHKKDLDADAELGKKYAEIVDKELKPTEHAEFQERLDRISAEIVTIANSKRVEVSWGDGRLNPFKYTFKVVKGDEVNAFSLPGGYIYFFDGLMKYVETDHELAGVIAHEISHASFRHIATLQRERSKVQAFTIPLILISLFAGGGSGADVAAGAQLFEQAVGSGWSERAELAADWGAVQYLVESPYDPTGILTFMERLARDERLGPNYVLGILRTHPPSRERAVRMTARMGQLNIPVRRSVATTSFRVVVKEVDGGASLKFNNVVLVTLAGEDAVARGKVAAATLNDFFDRVPALFDVRAAGGRVEGYRRPLLELSPVDAALAGVSREELANTTVRQIQRGIYSLAYRVWDY